MAADHARVKALFFEALDVAPDPVGPWLRRAADGDAELYAAVAELLEFHEDSPLVATSSAGPGGGGAPDGAPDPVGLVGARIADRYVVQRFVAEGGFAFVYRAQDTAVDGPVALKVFKEVDPAQRAMLEQAFRREARLLATLAADIPTLVGAHGLAHWERDGGPRLLVQILEWLDGDELRPVPGGEPLPGVVRKLTPVARALAAAHAAGVAHRDVKPGNIFVQADGRLRVLDFGIAKVAHERARGFASTATAGTSFTLDYAAPEQLLGQPTGPWTDVYSLAVVAVELACGRHPYAGLGALESMMVLADPHRRPSPRAQGLHVHDAVESAFLDALAVAPADRPGMREFWDALQEAARFPSTG